MENFVDHQKVLKAENDEIAETENPQSQIEPIEEITYISRTEQGQEEVAGEVPSDFIEVASTVEKELALLQEDFSVSKADQQS